MTIFPHILDSYFNESILRRAQNKKIVEIKTYDIREFAKDKHHTTDDKPFGGGPGMIMKVQPIYDCLMSIDRSKPSRVILLDPAGRQFDQNLAKELTEFKQLIFICGRYQDIDARVEELADDKISIGPYILSGGELAAAVIIEAVSRFLPGVLGNRASLEIETKSFPQYTRPRLFKTLDGKRLSAPEELISGDHKKILAWRKQK